MKLKGIHHIALNVQDLDIAENFYTKVLGFSVMARISTGVRHIMVDTGNSAVALFEAPELDTKSCTDLISEEGFLHFAFRADRDQFDSIIEELKEKSIDIEGPVKRGDGISVYFNDPDDNHLEIHCDND
jgi:glyoxylase I family protein